MVCVKNSVFKIQKPKKLNKNNNEFFVHIKRKKKSCGLLRNVVKGSGFFVYLINFIFFLIFI